jgi:hypothetical protein
MDRRCLEWFSDWLSRSSTRQASLNLDSAALPDWLDSALNPDTMMELWQAAKEYDIKPLRVEIKVFPLISPPHARNESSG